MANPWFPGNSASAFSLSFLATDPDPDPDNPFSLSRFPPLNSPSSKTPKSTRALQASSAIGALSSKSTDVASVLAKTTTMAVSSSSKSENTVHLDLEKFRILPPKSSSPIQTNRASKLSSVTLPLSPLPTMKPQTRINPILPSSVTPSPLENSSNSQASANNPSGPRIRKSEDKSLCRLAPPSFSDTGRPRILIPDSVFQKGAELHKDFIICYFNGRPPPFNHIQSVLNHLWGKSKRVEIHTNPLSRSMLVRIPSDYLRQKILEKRVWYVGDSMFQAVQWSSSASFSSPPLESIQIWAHLKGVPLDLRHQEGLSLVAGIVGDPKETDEFTLNLVSLTLSHVKVAVNLTKPLPSVVEFTRESGEVVEVLVTYPWVPPTCPHCKELGHIVRNYVNAPSETAASKKEEKNVPVPVAAAAVKNPVLTQSKPSSSNAAGSVAVCSTSTSASTVFDHVSGSSVPPASPVLAIIPYLIIPPLEPPSLLTSQNLSNQLVLFSPSPNSHPRSPDPASRPPLKRPRSCSSNQNFSSFTDQLNFFSSSSSLSLSHPQPVSSLPFNPFSNPFSILSPHGPLPPEGVIKNLYEYKILFLECMWFK
ncbi:hypothetical protein N665_0152s0025 [Sinapis alba]|nr:hypothetical protein N665_0152s0025 [Sinapis alba]